MTTLYRAALLVEKAPYVLTLFVAACGWLVTYTVARYEKVPLVEYSTSTDGQDVRNGENSIFSTTLRNISPSGLVACVRLQFTARDHGGRDVQMKNQELVSISGPLTDVIFTDRDKAVIFQMDLHPEAAVELPMTATTPATLTVRLAPCELPTGLPANGPLPVLMEASLKTSIIQHSLGVLWLGFIALAISLCWIYLYIGWTAADRSASKNSDHINHTSFGKQADPGTSSESSSEINR